MSQQSPLDVSHQQFVFARGEDIGVSGTREIDATPDCREPGHHRRDDACSGEPVVIDHKPRRDFSPQEF